MSISNEDAQLLNQTSGDVGERIQLGSIIQGLQEAPSVGPGSLISGQLKLAIRTIVIAVGSKTGTVINTADINGVLLAPYIASATLDATANSITSLQFIASTGQIIANMNANATAAVSIIVPVLQAA